MIGPTHSIIASFTGIGHGAAAWTMFSRLDRSYLARVSSGSLSIRLNIVGTTWVWVMPNRSTHARNPSGSNRSIMIVVAPRRSAAAIEASGAEWYVGAGDRYVIPGRIPKSIWPTNSRAGSGSLGWISGSG